MRRQAEHVRRTISTDILCDVYLSEGPVGGFRSDRGGVDESGPDSSELDSGGAQTQNRHADGQGFLVRSRRHRREYTELLK